MSLSNSTTPPFRMYSTITGDQRNTSTRNRHPDRLLARLRAWPAVTVPWAPSPVAPPTRTGCVGATAGSPAPRHGACDAAPTPPVVVDLGYGASPVTAVELHDRLRRVRADVQVVGIEIDPARVRDAAPPSSAPA